MYQNLSRTALKSSALALIMASSAMFNAPAAKAAITSGKQVISQAKVADLGGADVTTLDWRQAEMKLRFDLSSSDWIDGVEFILSMDPGDNVNRNAPILVSLNNAPPVTLRPKGNSFDARIRLDGDYARAKGNVITVSYPASNGACLTPDDGSWILKSAKSSVITRTRAKSRALYLNEVEDRLSNPVLAPKTVGIIATGSSKDRLEVLGAQGIGLRMDSLPNFRTSRGKSGMDVIIGKRSDISRFVTDRTIMDETGPKISVAKGTPLRLVITGDSDAHVLSAAKLFAQRRLPYVRRSEASEGELRFQRSFKQAHNTVSGKTKLSDMGFGFYARDWAATPGTLDFNVSDPQAQSGRVLLRLSSSDDIADNSKLSVNLNGRSLGYAQLNKRRKTVAFDIPEGVLKGADNRLTLTPNFTKANDDAGFICPKWDDAPGFYIGSGSRIELSKNGGSYVTDLSRLTAGSGPFADADGADTHIVMATKTATDRAAALKLVAKLAKSSGTGWAETTVSSLGQNRAYDKERNLMIIGPLARSTGLLDDAPKALSAALRGQGSLNFASSTEKFASLDDEATMEIYAARQRSKSRRAGGGGVAAIYPSASQPGTLTAVFSTAPGTVFSGSVATLTQDDVWNDLSGSVARWQGNTVLMAQTAMAAPAFADYRAPKTAAQGFRLASLDFTQWDYSGIEDTWLNVTDKAALSGAALMAKLNLDKKETAVAPIKTVETIAPAPIAAPQPMHVKPKTVPQTVRYSAPKLTATQPPSLRGFSNTGQMRTQTRLAEPSLWDKFKAPFARKTASPDVVKKAEAPAVAVPNVNVPKLSAPNVKIPELRIPDVTAPDFKTSDFNTDAMRKPKIKAWLEDAQRPIKDASRKWHTSNMERKIRDVQAKLRPIGTKIKNTVGSDRNPLKAWMIKADRTFSFFGILLAMAFIASILMLGIASPQSADTKDY
ncbi:cellulose biosynthesis cyclic di-GMP-binding regulatory protein BcsB [Fretibacter rubidus]|uniref:cellulose biosynthesis cyclic di-GMP-binding regulatory protein BcsB n=1 Tax=Fretibacter rubidus TaxID=570162 RepID=UPI00352A65C7